jgi:initiation factor 1A
MLCSGPESKAGRQDAFLTVLCRINTGDVILLSLREFQDGKGDVILKYSSEEARNLKAYGTSNL